MLNFLFWHPIALLLDTKFVRKLSALQSAQVIGLQFESTHLLILGIN
jgi:hypothetical protein